MKYLLLVTAFVVALTDSAFSTLGDNCFEPYVIAIPESLSYYRNASTCGFGNDYFDTGCVPTEYEAGADVVYRLDVSERIRVRIQLNTTGSYVHPSWTLDTECPYDGYCVASAYSYQYYLIEDYVTLDAGVYYLKLDNWPTNGCFTYILTIDESPLDPGEDCSEPIVISSIPAEFTDYTCSYDHEWAMYYTVCADSDTAADVVYRYDAVTDMFVNLSLCTAGFNTKLYVFEDGCYGTPIACNDNGIGACLDTLHSHLHRVQFWGDHTYYIVVDGVGQDCGSYTLSLSECPSGEICGSAIPLSVSFPQTVTGNTCGFWNDYAVVCTTLNSLGPDIVYSLTPLVDDTINIYLCAAYSARLYVYEDTCNLAWACGGSGFGFCTSGTQVSREFLPVEAGHAYKIVVDGVTNESCGDYSLTVAEWFPARPCSSCTPIDADLGEITSVMCGGSISGDCGDGGKWTASFIGEQDVTYHFDFCIDPPCGGSANFGGTDPDICICDADCHPLTATDGPESCNYHPNDWTWTCPAPGTYYVVIGPHPAMYDDTLRCNGNATQTFTMVYYSQPPRSCESCTPPNVDLADIPEGDCSGSIGGNCGYGGKWVGRFNGYAGETYLFDLCAMDPCHGSSDFGGTDPDVLICDADCRVLDWVDGPEACGFRPNQYGWTCTAAGTYYVIVAPYHAYANDTLRCNGNSGQSFTFIYSRHSYRPCMSCAPTNAELGDITMNPCGGIIAGNCGWDGKWIAGFNGYAGVTYHWDLCPQEPCSGASEFGGTDADIIIMDAACTILEWHDGIDTCGFRPNDYQWTCPTEGTYYIVIAPYPSLSADTLSCQGMADHTFTLAYWRDQGPTPGGETCETATALSGPLPLIITYNTCAHTDDYAFECWQPIGVGGRDVVYRYTPAADEFVTFNLCNTLFDATLYIFADSCSGRPWACNDVDLTGFCSNTSMPYLPCIELLAGHTYYIVIEAVNDIECGDFELTMSSCTPIEGDVMQTAFTIPSLPFHVSGSTDGMYDQYVEDCGSYSYSRDVVYAYEPSEEIVVEMDLAFSQFPVRVYVYRNTRADLFTCNSAGGPGNRAYIPPITMYPGDTYYIVIEGNWELHGTYVLDIMEAVWGRCCLLNGTCADYVTSRQCSYHFGHGTWTEGLTCASSCPAAPPPPAGPIDSAAVPVQDGCNYGVTLASACDGRLFYNNTCSDFLYTTNRYGDWIETVGITFNGSSFWGIVGCWDPVRELLWATHENKQIYLLDPSTGVLTEQFGTPFGTYDMDFDVADSTLWLHEPEGSVLYHYSTEGILLGIVFPLDTNGHVEGWLRGVCGGAGNTIYVSHADGRVTQHDKTTGAWRGLFAVNGAWQSRALTCDAYSFAPQTVMWWKFDNNYYAYTVPHGTCTCGCPPADSLVIRLNDTRDHVILYFYAPEAGTYGIFTATTSNAEYPAGFVQTGTVDAVTGRNQWTDTTAVGVTKRYVAVHLCP